MVMVIGGFNERVRVTHRQPFVLCVWHFEDGGKSEVTFDVTGA